MLKPSSSALLHTSVFPSEAPATRQFPFKSIHNQVLEAAMNCTVKKLSLQGILSLFLCHLCSFSLSHFVFIPAMLIRPLRTLCFDLWHQSEFWTRIQQSCSTTNGTVLDSKARVILMFHLLKLLFWQQHRRLNIFKQIILAVNEKC